MICWGNKQEKTGGSRADHVTGGAGVLVAGSWDTLLSVWPLAPPAAARDGRLLPPQPSHYLHGHDGPVAALAACGRLNAAASASAGGLILLHHLPTARVLMCLPALPAPPTLLAISHLQPTVLAYCAASRRLHAWHVHGDRLAECEVAEGARALAVSACGRLVVVAGDRAPAARGGRASAAEPLLLWVHSLKVRAPLVFPRVPRASLPPRARAPASVCLPHGRRCWKASGPRARRPRVQRVMRYKAELMHDEGAVLSLVATREGCLLVGTEQGSVVLLSPDTRRTSTRRLNLAMCIHDDAA